MDGDWNLPIDIGSSADQEGKGRRVGKRGAISSSSTYDPAVSESIDDIKVESTKSNGVKRNEATGCKAVIVSTCNMGGRCA